MCMPECTVCLWVRRFHEEKRLNIYNDEGSDRPSNTSTNETKRMVLAILEHDQKTFIICEIWNLLVDEHSIKISHMTVQHILASEAYTKVCAK